MKYLREYIKHSFVGKLLGSLTTSILLWRKGVILTFVHPQNYNLRNGTILLYKNKERAVIYDFVMQLKKKVDMQLGYNEAYNLYMAVRNTAKIPGDIAEVGVYYGGSAAIICEAKKNKILHLYDTFRGLPEVSFKDSIQFKKGQYNATLDMVKKSLGAYKNVLFNKGVFPQSALNFPSNVKFSFVHLDVDIYSSTKTSLEFFYPRMSKGGVIISHDYISSDGVGQAFDEFFKNKPEPIIELSGSQCLIVKV